MRALVIPCLVVLVVLILRPVLLAEEAPALKITSPRGGQTRARIASIEGVARVIEGARLTLVLNGVRPS